MIKFEVGYNFIEKSAVKNGKYENVEKKLGIFQFFKFLKKKELPDIFAITGFDIFFYHINDQDEKNLHQYIHQVLSDYSNYLLKHKPIIVIIVEERLVMNKTLKIYYRGKNISLTDIFGKTLIQKDLDWFHSNFSLS